MRNSTFQQKNCRLIIFFNSEKKMEIKPKSLKPIRIIVQSPEFQNELVDENLLKNISYINKNGRLVPFSPARSLMQIARIKPKKIENQFELNENSLDSFTENNRKMIEAPAMQSTDPPKPSGILSKLKNMLSKTKGFHITIAAALACTIVTGIVASVVTNYLTLQSEASLYIKKQKLKFTIYLLDKVDKNGFCYDDKSCIQDKALSCIKSVCTCKDGFIWENSKCTSIF